MKRVLLLFSFVALVLAGVASASRDGGPCCLGETVQANGHTQAHRDAHHQAAGCCIPKTGDTKAGMCMRGENGAPACCTPDPEGQRACCADGVCACCVEGACATKHQHGDGGCCQKPADGHARTGCCEKKDGTETIGGCCAKHAKHGAGS